MTIKKSSGIIEMAFEFNISNIEAQCYISFHKHYRTFH